MNKRRARDARVVSGRVAALCFSSAGELDVVLPLLREWNIEDFSIFVFKTELLTKIGHDSFYSRIVSGRVENRALVRISKNKVRRWLQFIGNALGVLRELRNCDYFLFEFGNSGREKNVLIALLAIMGRSSRILFYPHGHAVTPESAYAPNRMPPITRIAARFGARIVRLDGSVPDHRFIAASYPILRPGWIDYVKRNAPHLYTNHVVILSRDSHPQYLLPENRSRMLSDTVSVLSRHFPGSRIVLRAHPREFFDGNAIRIDGVEVEVTYENTYSVVHGAHCAVSFWTSAFFQCLALDVPVIEYHVSHDQFLALYPGGSLNAAFVPSCRSRAELTAQIEALLRRASTLAS